MRELTREDIKVNRKYILKSTYWTNNPEVVITHALHKEGFKIVKIHALEKDRISIDLELPKSLCNALGKHYWRYMSYKYAHLGFAKNDEEEILKIIGDNIG